MASRFIALFAEMHLVTHRTEATPESAHSYRTYGILADISCSLGSSDSLLSQLKLTIPAHTYVMRRGDEVWRG